jgi:hypothetical protein
LSSNPERVTRFEREARTLASLHHPNLASIFGLAQAVGFEEATPPRAARPGSDSQDLRTGDLMGSGP